ncbi:MAG: hypothetical protein D6B26_01535, partial [Spirochaetaceae bacterium]
MLKVDPIRRIFLLVGASSMLLIIAAGFWSNWVFEHQYLNQHQAELQENAALLASTYQRLAATDQQMTLLLMRDFIQSWDRRSSHRHRLVIQSSDGREILVFPNNAGLLAYSAQATWPNGTVTLHSTEPQPVYPSQLLI